MIGIDTNVLVRFLIQDEPEQTAKATLIFEQASDADPVFVNNIVMCELVWVLTRGYKYDKNLIVHVLEQLLMSREIIFENINILKQALGQYSSGKADFSDYLIALINKENQAKITYTFDKKAAKGKLFKLLAAN